MYYKRKIMGLFLTIVMLLGVIPGIQVFAEEPLETIEETADETVVDPENGMIEEEITEEEPAESSIPEIDGSPAPNKNTEAFLVDELPVEEKQTIEYMASPTMEDGFNIAGMEMTENSNGWVTYSKTEEQIEARREQIRQEVADNREAMYAQQEALRAQGIEYTPHSTLSTYAVNETERQLVGGYVMRGEAERMICQTKLGQGLFYSLYDLGVRGFDTVCYYKEEDGTLTKTEGGLYVDYYTYSVDVVGIKRSAYYFDEQGDSRREGSTKLLLSTKITDVVIIMDENGELSEIYQEHNSKMAIDVLISDEDFGLYEEGFTRTYMAKPGDTLNLDNYTYWEIDSYTVSDGLLDEDGRVRADAERGWIHINFKYGNPSETLEVVVYTDPEDPPLSNPLQKYLEDWYVDGKFQYWFPDILDYSATSGIEWRAPAWFDPCYYSLYYDGSVYSGMDFSDSNGTDGGPNLLPRAAALLEKVSKVDLANQGIYGRLPDLSPTGRALELDLSDNHLIGDIGYYTDGSLTLDLSNNQLTGIDGDMKSSAISKVNLSGNYISVEEIAENFRDDQLTDPDDYHQLTLELRDPTQTDISLEVGEKLEDKIYQGLFKLTLDGVEQPFSRLSELEFDIGPAQYQEESFNALFLETNGKLEAINNGSVSVNVGFKLPGEELPTGSNQVVTLYVTVGYETDSDTAWLRLYMENYKKVTGAFTLPDALPVEMSTVEWSSSNEKYLRPDGTVTRPQHYDVPVKLHAELSKPNGSGAGAMDFYVLVLAQESYTSNMVAASAFNDTHSMAVINSKLYSAGDNVRGQLGNGTFTDSNTPVEVINYLDQKMSSVKKVSNGLGYSMFLNRDGRVWAVGFNQYGKLGDGTSDNQNKAYPVRGKNGNGFLRDFADISAGYRHSIAVKNDGSVWAWGSNSTGQLGDGSHSTRTVPVRVTGYNAEWLDNIEKVYANADVSMALRSDGTVYMWGNNDKGQLGTGNKTNTTRPVKVRGENGDGYLEDITAIATAEGCSLALSRTGEVWSWGGNQNGRLGNGTTTERLYPGKVLKSDEFGGGKLTNIVAISAGYYFNAALDADGYVWVWGKNDAGQLGIGSAQDQYRAVKVKGLNGEGYLSQVKSISCGRGYMLAMQEDNTILAWGSNQYGQFGIGYTGQMFDTPTYAFTDSLYDDIEWLTDQMQQYKEVEDDISLPVTASGGSNIVWTSSDPYYITNDGKVMQPKPNTQDVTVTLSAFLTRDGETLRVKYDVKVLKNVNTNGSMQTAQNVNRISNTVGRIYDGQTKWYQVSSDRAGAVDLILKDTTPGATYGLALCDSTGAEIARDEQKGQDVCLTNQSITANTVYYIKVYMQDFTQEGNRFTLSVDFMSANNKDMKATVTEGKRFELAISGWTQPSYFLRYDPAFLQLIDAVAETAAADTEVGYVAGTPIEITKAEDGYIIFKVNGMTASEKMVNRMIFEAIQTGNTEISIDAY